MIPFSTWREIYRVRLLRENREAVRILSDMFYLLVALYRANRIQEFCRLSALYFRMIDSFMRYDSASARETLEEVLAIPWFRQNRQQLFRLISSYRRVMERMREHDTSVPPVSVQKTVNKDKEKFFQALKSLMDFDERDDARIAKLLAQNNLDETFRRINEALGYADG